MVKPRRILLITRNLPPLLGGMEQVNWHMIDQLARWAQVKVVAPSNSCPPLSKNVDIEAIPLRPLWYFLTAALRQSVRCAYTWKPDLVIAGSGLTAPIAWIAAKICRARSAAYLHGLDIGNAHPVYRLLWLPFLRRMDVLIANSSATCEIAITKGINRRKIVILPPGVEASGAEPHPNPEFEKEFRTQHNIGDGRLLLSVGRLTQRKGIREFVTDVFPQIARSYADVELIIVGDVARNAIAARSQSKEEIMAAAERQGLAEKVHFIGEVHDRGILSRIYHMCDVHIFPVQAMINDPEGFGMVAIEAASHGLPTVAYATGGIVDAVSDGISGYLAEPGNAASFATLTQKALLGSIPPESAIMFAQRFTWESFGAKLADYISPASSEN